MTDPAGSPPVSSTAPDPAPDSAPGPTAKPATSGLDWESLGRLGVVRDRNNGWVSGTCAGIAARFGVDPLLIRAGAIALAFTGGLGIPLYLAAWLLLPDASGRILLREAASGAGAPIVLAIALALSVMLPLGLSNQNTGLSLPPGVLAIAGAAAVIYLARRRQAGRQASAPPPPTSWTPPPPGTNAVPSANPYAAPTQGAPSPGSLPPPPPDASPVAWAPAPGAPAPDAVTWAPSPAGVPASPVMAAALVPPAPTGSPATEVLAPPVAPSRRRPRRAPRGTSLVVLALVIGAFWAAGTAAPGWGFTDAPWSIGIIAAFAAAAACTFVLGMLGRRGGLATLLTVVLLFPALIAGGVARSGQSMNDLVGESWAPSRAGETRMLFVSDAEVDLSGLTADDTGAPVRLSLGIGTANVRIPDDLPVVITMSLGAGDIDTGSFAPPSENRASSGVGIERSLPVTPTGTSGAEPVQVIIEVGVGSIVLEPTAAPTTRTTP